MIKVIKDKILKLIWGNDYVPEGLLELYKYFRHNEPIEFDINKENGKFIAVSRNFRYGAIVTSGVDQETLDKNIEDAILSSFDIPSSYSREAAISRVGKNSQAYAIA